MSFVTKYTYKNPEDQKLVDEVELKLAEDSGYKTKEDIGVKIQECENPNNCDGDEFKVLQCNTGIWEVWAKCIKCGYIFCLGTE